MISGYTDYQRYDDSNFYDVNFNGTSAAAPVATGVIALYLEANPKATSRDVKNWLKDRGSNILEYTTSTANGGYLDQYPDDTTTSYWTESFNLRGAEKRLLYDKSANDNKPRMTGVNISGISFKQT